MGWCVCVAGFALNHLITLHARGFKVVLILTEKRRELGGQNTEGAGKGGRCFHTSLFGELRTAPLKTCGFSFVIF